MVFTDPFSLGATLREKPAFCGEDDDDEYGMMGANDGFVTEKIESLIKKTDILIEVIAT